MSDHCIQLMMLTVQGLGVVGLGIYCFETYKIRKASQDQVIASQKLIKASLDQVEGSLKPCIAFAARLRDGADAILEMHGAVGNLIVQPDQGSYVIHNIGNGAALNLRYFFTRPDVAEPDWRYLPAVLATGRATLVESLGLYNAEHVATFEYESLAGENTAPRSTSTTTSSPALILRKSVLRRWPAELIAWGESRTVSSQFWTFKKHGWAGPPGSQRGGLAHLSNRPN